MENSNIKKETSGNGLQFTLTSTVSSKDRERAIEKIVYKLLETVKETVKLNKIHDIIYHGNWYEEQQK
jgi:hypothetical protein